VLATIKEAGAAPLELRDPVREAEKWLKRLAECRPADGNGAAEHATGSLCLAVVALAARAGVNPEDALRQMVDRLTRAFRSEETEIIDSGMLFGQVPAPQLRRMAERLLAECEKPGK
jgi:hypothetical protein